MDIIYLDQATARTMTDMKSLSLLSAKRNVEGKFDEAIEHYNGVYKRLMDELLGRV